MAWQYSLFLILAPLSAAAVIGTQLTARRYHDRAFAETSVLSWLVVSAVGWLALNTAELVAPTAAGTLFWARLSYLFIAATPLAWFAFALQYAGSRWLLDRARFAAFWVIPIITFFLAVTGSWYRLLWQSYEFVPVGPLLAMRVVRYGPWFWVYAAYAHLLVLLGAFLIGRQYFRSFRLFRRQSAWVIVGAAIPIVFNVVYVFRLIPGFRKDFTSVAIALASGAFVVGIYRYHLFDLKPVARETVVDSLQDAMLALDTQNRIVDFNPTAAHLFAGLGIPQPAQALVGRPVADVLGSWPELAGHLAGGMLLHRDVEIRVDGKVHTYDLQVSPLAGDRAGLAGRVLVLRDITSRKQAEEQLRRYAEELEVQNEELDAFARTVAHDLKDPLSTIISYAQFLHRSLEDLSRQELTYGLDVLYQTGHTLSNIVDELLLLAQVRRQSTVSTAPLDLDIVLARVQDRLARLILETGAEIVQPAAWPPVVSYAPWVEEVWVNYVSNALRYGGRPEEGIPPRVELGCDAPAAPGGTPAVRFWVRDNGPGLAEREQAELFVEFTHLVRSHGEGSGLGLAIVRRIVDKLGGQVGVESAVGQGSLFWFTLPAVAEEEEP